MPTSARFTDNDNSVTRLIQTKTTNKRVTEDKLTTDKYLKIRSLPLPEAYPHLPASSQWQGRQVGATQLSPEF